MKKCFMSALVVLSASLLISCVDSNDNNLESISKPFPQTPDDFVAMNMDTYSVLNTLGSGDNSGTLNNPFYWWSLMSDDCYGSGGLQDIVSKSLHHFTVAYANQYEYDFKLLYTGISRANIMIELIDNIDWTNNTAQRNQLLGEAFFMRGLYTMWLTQLYGDVPLITTTIINDDLYEQQSAADVIYPQIIADFVSGMNLMGTDTPKGDGHANKYVAEAFLARAYMFWAGFYKKVVELAISSAPAISLVDRNGEAIQQEGCSVSSISKANVVDALKDIVVSGRYSLLKDYRSLWQYSNSLLWDEAHDNVGHNYDFIADMDRDDCFDMPGNGNGNDEELFQIQFNNASKWAVGITYVNNLSYFWGLRNSVSQTNGKREFTYPFNQGLGQGTPSNNIWDDWTDMERHGNYTDIRKKASMIDVEAELQQYTYEKDDCEESGYAVKKYANVNLDACATDNDTWWSMTEGYTSRSLDNMMLGNHFEDFYLMRYADVLLMLTELTGDAAYMNCVQARAGVPQTPYSLKAIQNERRWEFAFEGLRFNDMRRWSGIDSDVNSYAAKALQAQTGKQIICLGDKPNKCSHVHMTCSWMERYTETNGFLPKPQNQISLTKGKIQQNPGWDFANIKTQYKAMY